MNFSGDNGKLFMGGQEFEINNWPADLIGPVKFFFDGQLFEQNAAGIYVPCLTIPGVPFPASLNLEWTAQTATYTSTEWPKSITTADIVDYAKKMLDQKEKDFASEMFGTWSSVSDASISKKHISIPYDFHYDSIYKSLAIPPKFLSDATYSGFAQAYSSLGQFLKSSPISESAALAAFKKAMLGARRNFVKEHEDSHLFVRQATKSHMEAFDEQEVLRAFHGARTQYAWSEVLKAHVPIY